MSTAAWAWGIAAVSSIIAVTAALVVLRLRRAWQADRADLRRLRRTAHRNADQISVVSHEIRTPLALMKGAADLLAEGTPGPLTPSQARFVETISANCHTVIDLAQDLLVQARIDAGMFELHLQRVDFRSLATGVVRELRLLHPVGIALDCPGAPPRAWADAKLMRQAITNLLTNAMAHAEDARLITLRIVGADEQVLISVSDDGSGMSSEQRQQLFERFASGRPLRDGTGLGLVITRQIVRMHGGEVYVDTTPGRGTTMMFSVPTSHEDSARPARAEAAS
ncbi:HAMP domain-containing sensor histidine kinase [Microbacterium sp.]|uniref:sensor histidine kinase n=1 Tax=Microbacterium sp. TaxID=51671 RepID=UPI00333F5EF1